MRTRFTELLGLKAPIIQAPMGGGIAGPELAAAVSNAGGLGTLPIWPMAREAAAQALKSLRQATSAPFAVNLNVAFDPSDLLELALEHSVPVVHFFWGDAAPYFARARAGGARTMATISSSTEARRAKDAGVDVLIAQGIEAGGHVWGQTGLMALVPAVVDAAAGCPVIAAGGIADGRGLAAALMLGASGVLVGTVFAASEESGAHPTYKKALLDACDSDTVLGTLFDLGWAGAPSRVLRNETVKAWELAGSPQARPAQGEIIARSAMGFEIPRYSSIPPALDVTGDVAAMALYAGQGVGLVRRVEPAAQILSRLVAEAEACRRQSPD